MTLAQRTPADSPFAVLYQRQPNTIICSMGRIKTERQKYLDATRVNGEKFSCTSNRTNSETASR